MIEGIAVVPSDGGQLGSQINHRLLSKNTMMDDTNTSNLITSARKQGVMIGEGRTPGQSSDYSIIMNKFGFNKNKKQFKGRTNSSYFELGDEDMDSMLRGS